MTPQRRRIAAATTAGHRDAETSGMNRIAAAATVGQKDAATPLEQRSEDPEPHPSRSDQPLSLNPAPSRSAGPTLEDTCYVQLPLGFTAAGGTFKVPVLGSAPFAVQ